MSLRRFFVYSFAVHVFIIAAMIFSIPAVKKNKKGGEFFTRLISPDEFLSQKPILPIPKMRSAPHTLPGITKPSHAIKEKETFHNEPKGLSGNTKNNKNNPPPLNKGGQVATGDSPRRGEFTGETNTGIVSNGNKPRSDRIGPSLKEKLFDRSIISDLAKRDIEKEEKEKKDKTFTFDTSEYKFLIYNMRLKERIENIWVYPHDAAAKGIYGDLVIKFTIKKNGKLGAIELIRTSGHKNLDDAAIKALRDGEPYWPLPEEWGMEAYTIVGHFIYAIYGYYVM